MRTKKLDAERDGEVVEVVARLCQAEPPPPAAVARPHHGARRSLNTMKIPSPARPGVADTACCAASRDIDD